MPVLIEDPAKATVTGTNNWLASGTRPGSLVGTVFGSDPGFKSLAGMDYTLAAGSGCIGAFEHTTIGPGLGPYGMSPPDGGLPPGGDSNATGPRRDGCGCTIGGGAPPRRSSPVGSLLVVATLACAACRRRARRAGFPDGSAE